MPDTSAAREAIREAYEKHREVMGGMSMAMLKLEAAAGFYSDDDVPLPYAEDDPVWVEHALSGLNDALAACDQLRAAIAAAIPETAKVARQMRVPADSPLRCQVPMTHADKSEAQCVLHRDHQLDDTDHLDEHGHHAPVLVHQSTIEDVRAWAGVPFPHEAAAPQRGHAVEEFFASMSERDPEELDSLRTEAWGDPGV